MSKGLWLPIELLKDKSTTMQEKLILVEINQLSMLDKGCVASNNHFSELFGIKKESVSRSISSLENKGFITTKIKDGSRNHERTITINKMLFEYKQNVIDPLTNCLETKDNKTINKTINISYDDFSIMWNNFASENNLSKVAKLSDSRKKKILARHKDFTDFRTAFNVALNKASQSSFLLNGNFFCFDWLIENDTNILKVIENKYKDKDFN